MARDTALCFLFYLLGALQTLPNTKADWCVTPHRALSNGTVSQSTLFHNDPTYSAMKAIDDDPNTCFKTSLEYWPWWQLDLGETINVSMIQIKNSDQHPVVLQLQVLYGVGQGGHLCGFKHILGGGETRVVRCDPMRKGSVLKIRSLQSQSFSLCEVLILDYAAEVSKGVNYEAWFDIPQPENPVQKSSGYEHLHTIPSGKGVFESFQSPRNIGDHYGYRLITYYSPPQSGNYTFYLSSDNSSRLFLTAPSRNPVEIAIVPRDDYLPRYTEYDQWNESFSSPQTLKKDEVYTLTVLMKEEVGNDHLRVGVRLPNGEYERPMRNRIYTSIQAAWARYDPCKTEEPSTEETTTDPEVLAPTAVTVAKTKPVTPTAKTKPVTPATKTRTKIEAAVESLRQHRISDMKKLRMLKKLEKFGIDRAKSLVLGISSFASFVLQSEEFVLAAVALNLDSFDGFSCPGSFNSSLFNGGNVHFPATMFSSKKGRAYMTCMMFQPLGLMKENTGNIDNTLAKRILSAVIEPRLATKFKEPVELVFKNIENINRTNGDCVFWIEDENSTAGAKYGRWSNEGCSLVHKNVTHIVCQCDHLTKFTVLFPVAEGSREDERRIELITYIGLSLSSVGCFITFIVYLVLRITKTLKTIVHLNLVFALGLADLMFLLGNFAERNKAACFGTTILTFYLYLVVFAWMLVEGVHLYFLVIKVFGRDEYLRKRLYYVIGWGIPMLIVTATAALMGYDLVAKNHCWLSSKNGAVWAFVGPVLFVILVNIVILSAVLRTTLTVLRRDPGHRREKSAMRTLALLVPILGVTWVVGVIAFAHDSIVIQYIFAVCNAFQGFFIFILYCLLNSEVRSEYDRKLQAWKTGREIESKRSKQANSDFAANFDLLTQQPMRSGKEKD